MIKNEDTGSALRSLYEPQGGVRAIFASKVADYIASRPDYPDALFDALAQSCGLRDGATIADIGAGTGLLTQGLLTRGQIVRPTCQRIQPIIQALQQRLWSQQFDSSCCQFNR